MGHKMMSYVEAAVMYMFMNVSLRNAKQVDHKWWKQRSMEKHCIMNTTGNIHSTL